MLGQAERFTYFRAFVVDKIRKGGVKQAAIAVYIGKSATYIHKLYKGDLKSCPDKVQEKVADFFSVTIDSLIREGRNITIKNSYQTGSNKVDFKDMQPALDYQTGIAGDDIKNILRSLNGEIEKLLREQQQQRKEIDLYKLVLQGQDNGITIFDGMRNFVFSSNKWGFLDGIDLSTKPSIDEVMLTVSKKIENFNEVRDVLIKFYSQKENASVEVKLINGSIFEFTTQAIYSPKGEFVAMVLNNRPLKK